MTVIKRTAFAYGGQISVEEAKQIALNYAGVNPGDAIFTKAYQDYEDGRLVYEIGFCADNTRYEMNVDAYTGMVTDFDNAYFGGYSRPACGPCRDGDWDDWDDPWDDWDDMFDWD